MTDLFKDEFHAQSELVHRVDLQRIEPCQWQLFRPGLAEDVPNLEDEQLDRVLMVNKKEAADLVPIS